MANQSYSVGGYNFDANGNLLVSGAGGAAPTGAATSANQQTEITALQAIQTNTAAALPAGTNVIGKVGIDQTTPGTTNAVVATGNVAAGTADSGNGIKISGVYNTTLPTLTNGQRGDLQLGTRGSVVASLYSSSGTSPIQAATNAGDGTSAQVALSTSNQGANYNGSTWDRQRGDLNGSVSQPFAMAASRWQYPAPTGGIVNSNTAVVLVAAAGAGVRNYLARLQINNGTLATGSEIVILDGSTVIWRILLTPTAQDRSYNFDSPLRGSANTSMSVQMITASATGGVYVNAQGFQSAV